ncbi:hypothetical protein GPECTOR_11g69 [Gonium pectorale]|uniref:Peptidase M16 N-terminal domain-containing protein n=1 Tax=Gonium pectorale TaxID=33097 RepID=A0A150GQ65_GONPE|nr:hypothetical protein GPECTOR_11g69 [Gonium pectorale]|eukprot:KXZ51944.1 hypothetical protein GPECTOR_11g69 [Gonium pectorale]
MLRPAAHAGASAIFGQRRLAPAAPAQQQQRPGGRGAASSGRWLHVAACRRGATLVLCAALAPSPTDASPVEALLEMPIKPESELVVGRLENGMQYVLLPNKLPPKRFEAHLEVHAGSVDEREDEQGVAHLVEHVTFLGSKRREELLGTGARANAYTDFHHTVFHVHAPAVNSITGQPMLPQIYEALNASVAVLRDIRYAPVNRRELARAKTTLLTRHESDLKDNAYWLGLLTHLQNPHVPHKTLECLRDLQRLYDAATVDDIKYVYEQFNFDDDHIFTCVGTSGKEAPPAPEHPLSGMSSLSSDEEDEGAASYSVNGSTANGGANGQLPNPMALFTAWMAAAKMDNLRSAVSGLQQPEGGAAAGGGAEGQSGQVPGGKAGHR